MSKVTDKLRALGPHAQKTRCPVQERSVSRSSDPVQGYLAHKKPPPRRTLQYAYAYGLLVVLGGWRFLMSEIPLYRPASLRVALARLVRTDLFLCVSRSRDWLC